MKATMRSSQKIQNMNTTYKLQVTVAVIETKGDKIEEFTDALSEIHDKKLFPCSECDKVCKSKGGLTRHIN